MDQKAGANPASCNQRTFIAKVAGFLPRFFSCHPKAASIFLFSLALAYFIFLRFYLNFLFSTLFISSLTFLFGIFLTSIFFSQLFKKRTKLDIPTNILSDDLGDPSEFLLSGVRPFDELLLAQKHKLEHVTETIALIGEEAEILIDRYETLTENLAAAVVIRDKDGGITYCSPYTEVLTGHSLSTIYESVEDFFVVSAHEQDRDQFQRALSVSKQGEAFQFRYRFFHKTGIEMWAEMRTVPVVDEEGSVVATLSITLDVTGTVRYQQQVEEKNKDLQDFAYMISHDLKAPIFTIKGMLNILQTDHRPKFQGEAEEILNHIDSAAHRLSVLVHAVLEYSKITNRQNSNEPVSLNQVFKEVLSDHASLISQAKAKIIISENTQSVLGDQLMVYQIFSNLIGNALKYRDLNRPSEIRVEVKPIHARNCVTITVSDNGLGIPEDKLDGIFRPFQRVHKTEVEGTGIGLACVKKLIHKLNGEISVSSEVNVGSTFSVTLPAYRIFGNTI